jgi:hypothetical protein
MRKGRIRVSTDALVTMSVVGVLVFVIATLLAMIVQPPESPFAGTQPPASIDGSPSKT